MSVTGLSFLHRIWCFLGRHAIYTCDPECCGKTLCVWCGKECS